LPQKVTATQEMVNMALYMLFMVYVLKESRGYYVFIF